MSECEPCLIEKCPACGQEMDVTALEPFSLATCPHCGEKSRVRTRVGGFELRSRLGVGGMSYVFAAYDRELDREVAVKVQKEEVRSKQERVSQFKKEAQVTASLNHPHIVRVFKVGEQDEYFYIAMELIDGESLEARMRRDGALPEAEVLRLARQVVEGLQIAKREHLIHRDIKPGNILIDANGNAKIVDFGLALLTNEELESREIWATPYYVPPETLEGQREDFRSDIYALGATLYHALAGRPPCPDDSLSIDKLKLAKRQIEPFGQAVPTASRTTAELIELSMAHSPGDRFESYAMMLEAIDIAERALITGEVPPPLYGSARDRRRAERGRKRKRLGLAGFGIATLGFVALSIYFWQNSNRPVEIDDTAKVEAEGAMPISGAVDEASSEIGELYEVARMVADERKFGQAADLFKQLMARDGVPLVTAAWCGIEAVVNSYQAGEVEAARATLHDLRRIVEEVEIEVDASSAAADRIAAMMLQIPPIGVEQLPTTPRGIEIIGVYAAALKNWEQGDFAGGQVLLRKFINLASDKLMDNFSIYQEQATAYLRDAERLAAIRLPDDLDDLQKIQQTRAEIEAVYPKLETLGRARVQVRSQILSLANRERELREQVALQNKLAQEAARQATEPIELWPAITECVNSHRFDSAVTLLVEHGDLTLEREQMSLYLLEIAHLFQLGLVAIIQETAVELEGRDGQVLGTMKDVYEAGLVIEQGESGETRVPWNELSIEQLDRLFTEHLRTVASAFQRRLRLEQLLAFRYLIGDRDRALQIAERFEVSEIKSIWQRISEMGLEL